MNVEDEYGATPVEGHESPLGGELHEKDMGWVDKTADVWTRVRANIDEIMKAKGDRVVGVAVILAIGGTEDGSEQNHVLCDAAIPPNIAPYCVDALVSQIKRAQEHIENDDAVDAAERHLNRAERRRRERGL